MIHRGLRGWASDGHARAYGRCDFSHVCAQPLSHVWHFATPWTVARQGASAHGILQARTLEWGAMPSSMPSHPGIEPTSPAVQVDSLPTEPPGKPGFSRGAAKLKSHQIKNLWPRGLGDSKYLTFSTSFKGTARSFGLVTRACGIFMIQMECLEQEATLSSGNVLCGHQHFQVNM